MAKDPRKVAEKQIRRAKEAAQDYVDGVGGVTEAPGAAAVKKQAKLKENFNRAVDSGKWAENTAAVSREFWVQRTQSKGGERYASGVEESREDIIAFHEDFQPKLAAVKRELDGMPDATPEQRKAKMNRNFDLMSKLKRTKRRR